MNVIYKSPNPTIIYFNEGEVCKDFYRYTLQTTLLKTPIIGLSENEYHCRSLDEKPDECKTENALAADWKIGNQIPCWVPDSPPSAAFSCGDATCLKFIDPSLDPKRETAKNLIIAGAVLVPISILCFLHYYYDYYTNKQKFTAPRATVQSSNTKINV